MEEKTKPICFIIIVTWNQKKDTLETLDSLSKINYPNFHIILVDNASKDNTKQEVEKTYLNKLGKLTYITKKENTGFAGGNNTGIKYAYEKGADYILLLNNDVEVKEDFLTKMINTAKKYPSVGIIGPKIYYHNTDKTLWYAGGKVNLNTITSTHFGVRKKDKGQYNKRKIVDYVTGCAFLIKSELITNVGYLDESFFIYYEETDYCLRAKNQGYLCLYEPQAIIWHKVSMATGGRIGSNGLYYNTRNKWIFLRKHGNSYLTFIPFFFIRNVLATSLYCCFKFKFKSVLSIFKGAIDGIFKKTGKSFN